MSSRILQNANSKLPCIHTHGAENEFIERMEVDRMCVILISLLYRQRLTTIPAGRQEKPIL